jgi:predicted HicB family RNase H-like nuclease
MLKAKQPTRERKDKAIALSELTKETTKRLNAEIPVQLHKKLKMLAIKRDKSITELLIEIVNEYLSKNSKG